MQWRAVQLQSSHRLSTFTSDPLLHDVLARRWRVGPPPPCVRASMRYNATQSLFMIPQYIRVTACTQMYVHADARRNKD